MVFWVIVCIIMNLTKFVAVRKLLSLKRKLKRHHLRSPQFLFQLYQLSAKFGPKLIVGNQTKIIQFSLQLHSKTH